MLGELPQTRQSLHRPVTIAPGPYSVATLPHWAGTPLQWAIDKLARVDPAYRERILAHEAAHFLVAYCLGVPVTGYSVDIGTDHIEVVDTALERTLFQAKVPLALHHPPAQMSPCSTLPFALCCACPLRSRHLRSQAAASF